MRAVRVYCGACVGPAMQFTEMPECGTEFIVIEDDPVEPSTWVLCPKCGADCEIDWRSAAEYSLRSHEWLPQCPYGDVCTGCDAIGRCTRVEPLRLPIRACPLRELGQR